MPHASSTLVHVTPAHHGLPRALLERPGGFAWWYLDAVSPAGDGVVLIWSFGLPFLPGYLDAARRGRGQLPADRPSLNLAVYRNGEPTFYLLQEYGREGADWDGHGRWHFGRSQLRSATDGGRRVVEAVLRCPVPGTMEHLRGTIRLDGPEREAHPTEVAPPGLDAHDWSPLTGPARVRVDLHVGQESLAHFEGRGYHDRNGSALPFDRLGIRHWIWGRAPFEDRELVYYVLWPEAAREAPIAYAVEVDSLGRTTHHTDLSVALEEPRLALYGMPYYRRVRLTHGDRLLARVELGERIDDGPFYLRFLSRTSDGEGEVLGTCEVIRPGRVDTDAQRPFVRMRVHQLEGENSMWLPLFSGPRSGRLGRLLSGVSLGNLRRTRTVDRQAESRGAARPGGTT